MVGSSPEAGCRSLSQALLGPGDLGEYGRRPEGALMTPNGWASRCASEKQAAGTDTLSRWVVMKVQASRRLTSREDRVDARWMRK